VSPSLEQKIDRLISLLEEQELASYRKTCNSNKNIGLNLATNTILASMVGYFLFRIMDAHFRGKTPTKKHR